MNGLYDEARLGRVFVLRLRPKQSLLTALRNFLVEKKIYSAYIPTIFGNITNATLLTTHIDPHNPDIPKDEKKCYEESLVYSGTGTVAWREKEQELFIHIHVVAGMLYHTISGHLIEADVCLTTEVVIQELLGIQMVRDIDNNVGGEELLHFKQ